MSKIAERVETVRLTAQVSNYIAGMQQASKATQQTTTEAQKLAQQGAAMQSVGRGLLVFGGLVAAGVAVAVKAFADFDAKMSQVKTLSGATSEEMLGLAEAAKTLGQSIGLSAEQVADAEIELVKAGVSVSDIMGGALKGSLELAAAGQIDVADATEIATVALTQFGLAGKDIPHVADLLAAGADKALGGVQDLGEALKSGGLVAAQFGVSLDETVGTLSAFANAGLIGETAGTDLRQLLLKLADPATETAKRMEQLGLKIYDTSGKFIGLAGLAGQLKDKLGGLSDAQRNQALAMIFGSRAIAGANVLYKEGAEGIEKWTDEVNDSGFAAHQAAGKMDNLNGDIQKLGAAFQTDLIDTGSQANDVLRQMVQAITFLVKLYGDLPAPIQGTVLAVGAVVAVISLAAGAFLVLVPRIAATKAAMADLKITMSGTAAVAGAVGGALTALTLIVGYFAQQQAEASANTDDFKSTLDESTGAITKNTQAMVVNKLGSQDLYKVAKESGISQKELTAAVLEGGDALDTVKAKFSANNTISGFFTGVGIRAGNASVAVQGLSQSLSDSQDQFRDEKAAAAGSADSTQDAAKAYSDAAQAASNLTQQISDLVKQINDANGVGQDAVTSNAAYQKALADATTQVNDYTKAHGRSSNSLKESTAAGSANAAMLADLAKRGQDAAATQFALDQNTDTYLTRLKANHDVIVKNAEALGDTKDQAEALADKIAHIPSDKEIKILVSTAQANAVINGFIKAWDGTPIHVNVDGSFTRNGQVYRAGGGIIPGPPSTSDTVSARLSTGEYVVNSAATAKNKDLLDQINYGFANGGFVQAPPRDPVVHIQQPQTATPAWSAPEQSGPIDLSDATLQKLGTIVVAKIRAAQWMRDA